MSLEYALVLNLLTPAPDDYRAVVPDASVKTVDELVDDVLASGTTITKADMLAVLEGFETAVVRHLTTGGRVTTPLFNAGPSIRGVFEGKEDRFDPSRHTISLNLSPGLRLRKVPSEIKVEKVTTEAFHPVLDRFEDAVSGEANSLITPGGGGTLLGSNLKIRDDNAAAGIFFINASNEETKAGPLLENRPGKLIFLIPELPAGSYTLEVRTTSPNSDKLRSRQLEADLTVAG
jgi:hypothetical protein